MAGVPIVSRREHLEDTGAMYQNQHITIMGPTGKGKTHLVGGLIMVCANAHRQAYYLHGKIKGRDKTIERISKVAHMPIISTGLPTRVDRIRHRDEQLRGWIVRPLEKPGEDTDSENALLRREFARTIRANYHTSSKQPRITILNETHQAHNDLKLRGDCEGPLMRGRPDNAMWSEIQRSRHVSYMCYDQPGIIYIFKDDDIDNQRRYGEIGGVDPTTIRELSRHLKTRVAPDGSVNSQCLCFRRISEELFIVDFLTPMSSTMTIGVNVSNTMVGRRGAPRGKQGAPQMRPRSFLVGTQDVLEGGDYDQTVSSGSGAFPATSMPPWTLQATGWLARLWFYCTYTSTAGSGVQANGPFNFFGTVQLNDVNNEAIFGPFDGYTWFLTNKYGGYYWLDDPSFNSVYTATGTAGTFVLCIPLEIVSRDPLGPVASVNNTATLTVLLITNAASTALTGAMTASSLRVRGLQEFYWEPRKQDKQGRQIAGAPPANGTTQYWTQGSVPVAAAGTINQQLITGLGYPFRSYLFMYVDSGGTRATGETDWPDPLIGLKFEANFLLTQYNKAQWQAEISRCTGHSNAAFDTRGPLGTGAASNLGPGKENGVYPIFFNKDFLLKRPGGETRRTYLVTSPGSNYIFNGALANGGNLYSIVNYVAPGGGGGTGNAASRHQDTSSLTQGQ